MSENGSAGHEARKRLDAVLAAYGADPARWPAADRERLAFLIGNLESGQAVEDARTIDAILDRASRPVPPPGAVERLIARAGAPGGIDARRGNILQLRPLEHDGHAKPEPVIRPAWVAAVSALAASLLLGIYLGASGLTEGFMPRLLTGNGSEITSAELEMVNVPQQPFDDEMEL